MLKCVILAGGFGTRISEESHLRPKPMISIGENPILWHIMKYYHSFGVGEFIICAGYKQESIKEYFSNYGLHNSNITFDFSNNGSITIHSDISERWKVTVVDTGLNTMTGGRIKRIKSFIGDGDFFMTYGDGVSNVDLDALLSFHRTKGSIATLTAIQPEGRFGVLDMDADCKINSFREKEKDDTGWINGGFMVLNSKIFDYIDGDANVFERDTLSKLAKIGKLSAFKHYGFWQCMDTLRDKEKLEHMWEHNEAPWRKW